MRNKGLAVEPDMRSVPSAVWLGGFGEFLTAVGNAAEGRADRRLIRAAAGANETLGAAGGFLLGPEFERDLLFRVYAKSLAGWCTTKPCTSSSVHVPTIDESSRVSGSRFGGVSSGW